MRMNNIRNFVKVSGTKEFVDYIMAHLEKADQYIFHDESSLKANDKDEGFHKFKEAQKKKEEISFI